MRATILTDINRMLDKYVPVTKEITGKDLSVGRIRKLLEHVGNPHERLRIIHIAGTSGKTSTAYYCAELLRLTGKKVGLTVSPHVDSITERVQIDSRPIEDEYFRSEMSEFLKLIEEFEPLPSYFEVLIAFAFWLFEKEQVDYAVVETGLGGLHDGTNVADKPDKVCVITDIGFDHTHIIGNTLREIAEQKAGIIHEGNDVFVHRQSDEVMKVIENAGLAKHARIHTINPTNYKVTAELPSFQKRNWDLAYAVVQYVLVRDNLTDLNDEQLIESTLVVIPGRMDIRAWGDKLLIMDGAHNAQKMAAFLKSFNEQFPNARPAVLLSVRTKKDFGEIIDMLAERASAIILTTFKVVQDISHESEKMETITEYCKTKGFTNIVIEPDKQKALQILKNQPEKICIITGSFYLLHHVRPLLRDKGSGS